MNMYAKQDDSPSESITINILKSQLDKLERLLADGISNLSSKLAVVEKRFNILDSQMDIIETRIDDAEKRIDKIESTLDSINEYLMIISMSVGVLAGEKK